MGRFLMTYAGTTSEACIKCACYNKDAFKMGCNRYCSTVGVYSNMEAICIIYFYNSCWNYYCNSCAENWTEIERMIIMFKNCVFNVSVSTKKWLKKASIRAIKTMAQTAIGVIGTEAVISSVDWKMVVSASIVAGVVSILTSVAGIPEVESEVEDNE